MRAQVNARARHDQDDGKREQAEPPAPQKERKGKAGDGRSMAGGKGIVGVLPDQPPPFASHPIPTLRGGRVGTRPTGESAQQIRGKPRDGSGDHHRAQHAHPVLPSSPPGGQQTERRSGHQPMPGEKTTAQSRGSFQARPAVRDHPMIQRRIEEERKDQRQEDQRAGPPPAPRAGHGRARIESSQSPQTAEFRQPRGGDSGERISRAPGRRSPRFRSGRVPRARAVRA